MVEKVRSLVALVAGNVRSSRASHIQSMVVLLYCNSCLHNVVVVGVYCVLRKNYYITITNNFNERKRWSGKCLVRQMPGPANASSAGPVTPAL